MSGNTAASINQGSLCAPSRYPTPYNKVKGAIASSEPTRPISSAAERRCSWPPDKRTHEEEGTGNEPNQKMAKAQLVEKADERFR